MIFASGSKAPRHDRFSPHPHSPSLFLFFHSPSSSLLPPRIVIFTFFFFFPCILSLAARVHWEKFQNPILAKKKDTANSSFRFVPPLRDSTEKRLLAFGRDPKARYSPFDSLSITSSPSVTFFLRIDLRARKSVLTSVRPHLWFSNSPLR